MGDAQYNTGQKAVQVLFTQGESVNLSVLLLSQP